MNTIYKSRWLKFVLNLLFFSHGENHFHFECHTALLFSECFFWEYPLDKLLMSSWSFNSLSKRKEIVISNDFAYDGQDLKRQDFNR